MIHGFKRLETRGKVQALQASYVVLWLLPRHLITCTYGFGDQTTRTSRGGCSALLGCARCGSCLVIGITVRAGGVEGLRGGGGYLAEVQLGADLGFRQRRNVGSGGSVGLEPSSKTGVFLSSSVYVCMQCLSREGCRNS